MASSRSQPQAIHQDYIARIRYSNTLPPPPNPPKLLDIPNTGLASGQYTAPGYASRLAREQPLNIEADGELGMQIDLLGMPGIFDGDESSISAPKATPAPHPKDRLLLRSLASINKPTVIDSKTNFLLTDKKDHHGNMKIPTRDAFVRAPPIKRKEKAETFAKLPDNVDKESPEYITASINRTFEVAQANLANPARLRHPSKRNVKLVSSHAILADLQAATDCGGYVSVKYTTNPVKQSTTYDVRLDTAMLAPNNSEARMAQYERAMALHKRDPAQYPQPPPLQDYHLYIPETVEDAIGLKRKFDVNDLDAKTNDDLYTYTDSNGNKTFRFKHQREYETSQHDNASMAEAWNKEVAIVINDGKDGKHQKAAYFYPVMSKTTIRPQRSKNINKQRFGANEEDPIPYLLVRVVDKQEGADDVRAKFIADPLGTFQNEEEAHEEPAEKVAGDANAASHADADGDADMDADADADGEPDDVQMTQ